jgi:glycosyltransferase involved in cell wall biosynthesis
MNFTEKRLPDDIEAFLNNHRPVICCTGFYETVYGFELAITGIKKLKDRYSNIGLIIIANKTNAQKYEKMIAEYGLCNNVFLCDDLGHEECLTIIKRSSVFLRPTMYDGDSISVREALMLRTPVVASDTEFRPEGVFIFRKGDLKDMVDKLLGVFQKNITGTTSENVHNNNLEKIRKIYMTLIPDRSKNASDKCYYSRI